MNNYDDHYNSNNRLFISQWTPKLGIAEPAKIFIAVYTNYILTQNVFLKEKKTEFLRWLKVIRTVTLHNDLHLTNPIEN